MTSDEAERATRAIRRLPLPDGVTVEVARPIRGFVAGHSLAVVLVCLGAPTETFYLDRFPNGSTLSEIRATAVSMANVAAYAAARPGADAGGERAERPPAWLTVALFRVGGLGSAHGESRAFAAKVLRALEFDAIPAPTVESGSDGVVVLKWYGDGRSLLVMAHRSGFLGLTVYDPFAREPQCYETGSKLHRGWGVSAVRSALRYVFRVDEVTVGDMLALCRA